MDTRQLCHTVGVFLGADLYFFFGLSPLLAHTVLVMLMNLQISLMVVGLKRFAQLFFLKCLVKHIHTGESKKMHVGCNPHTLYSVQLLL